MFAFVAPFACAQALAGPPVAVNAIAADPAVALAAKSRALLDAGAPTSLLKRVGAVSPLQPVAVNAGAAEAVKSVRIPVVEIGKGLVPVQTVWIGGATPATETGASPAPASASGTADAVVAGAQAGVAVSPRKLPQGPAACN
jgi:hypothetical protein